MHDGPATLALALDLVEQGTADDDVIAALLNQGIEPEALADAHAGAVFLADTTGGDHARRVVRLLADAVERSIERRWSAGVGPGR